VIRRAYQAQVHTQRRGDAPRPLWTRSGKVSRCTESGANRRHPSFPAILRVEGGIEGVIPYFSEDVVVYSIPEWPDDPEYHGHEGLRRLFRQWNESFDDFALEPREFHDGGDSVVALVELTGQMKRADVPMKMEIGATYSGIKEGRVTQLRLFSTWRGALEAAGLLE
jgi:ketosteroid isomerase-like protein